jgi:hypothetical protein
VPSTTEFQCVRHEIGRIFYRDKFGFRVKIRPWGIIGVIVDMRPHRVELHVQLAAAFVLAVVVSTSAQADIVSGYFTDLGSPRFGISAVSGAESLLRFISGTVAAIPLSSAGWLFGAALVGLIFLSRSRRIRP